MSGIDIEGTLSVHTYVTFGYCAGCAWTPPDQADTAEPYPDQHRAHVAAVLREHLEGALAEAKRDALANEAEWLHGAHANSHDKGYSAEYRKGFLAAAGWVRFHARMDHLSDTERAGGAG